MRVHEMCPYHSRRAHRPAPTLYCNHHPRRLVVAPYTTNLRGWWCREQAPLTKHPEFNLVGWYNAGTCNVPLPTYEVELAANHFILLEMVDAPMRMC